MPEPIDAPAALLDGLGAEPKAVLAAFDYIVVFENEAQVRALTPDCAKLPELDNRGVVVTAPGDDAGCEVVGDRVILTGDAVDYLQGTIKV